MLHMVIREHLDDFLRTAANQADGAALPEFIVREFRDPRLFLLTASAGSLDRAAAPFSKSRPNGPHAAAAAQTGGTGSKTIARRKITRP